MRRIVAHLALMLGLAALIAPAQARVFYEASATQVSRVDRSCSASAARSEAEEAKPRTSRARKNRELGTPPMRQPQTVLLPPIFMSDCPRE